MCCRWTRRGRGGTAGGSWLWPRTPTTKPADQAPANGQEPAKEPQKVDEFAEAQKALGGPAGNPECVWLGRRVVSLLWRDDLDTAFRHLDLYDRFGCPSGHIQATFRCLLLHSNNIDPKAADSLNGRVNSCWINPNLQATPPAAARPRRVGAKPDHEPLEGACPASVRPRAECRTTSRRVVLNLPCTSATCLFAARKVASSPYDQRRTLGTGSGPCILAPRG